MSRPGPVTVPSLTLVRQHTTAYIAAMNHTMTASEARAGLPAVLDLVEAGEAVTITRHGRAVAVVMSPASVHPARSASALERALELRLAREGARGADVPDDLDDDAADRLRAHLTASRRERPGTGTAWTPSTPTS